ncbi:MAG: hypothetical protein WBO23_15640 [Burkholderiales bacterium]
MESRAAIAILALFALACSPELDWRDLRSAEGDFSALMPSKPRYEVRALEGTPPVTMHLWSARAANSLFGVGYVDYPVADGRVLERTRDALVGNIRGRLLEDVPVAQAGLRGRAFVAEGGDSLLRTRLLVSGTRLYQLVVLGRGASVSDADAEFFLSSFHPLKPAAAE